MEKYQAVRDLIEEMNCPTIIYVSRTRKAYLLAERLTEDGFHARPYHGKMDVKEKPPTRIHLSLGRFLSWWQHLLLEWELTKKMLAW